MNILFVVPYYACDEATGGGQRTRLLFQSLLSLDNASIDVVVLCEQEREYRANFVFAGARSIVYKDILPRAKVGFWKIFRSLSPSKLDLIATAIGRRSVLYSGQMLADSAVIDFSHYQVVAARYLRVLAQTGIFQKKRPAKIYLDIDDRDDVLYSSRLNSPDLSLMKKWLMQWHLYQIKHIQKKYLPQCHQSWLASSNDLNQLPTSSESVLSNIPYRFSSDIPAVSQCATPSNKKTVLFVGSYGHRINQEGVEYFIKTCWPAIIEKLPDAVLRIVGSGGWEKIAPRLQASNNIEIVGFCDDLETEYQNALFTVVPLYEGGGTKIKVLESYLFSRLAIGTEHAYYGYDHLATTVNDAVAKTDKALINTIIHFLENPGKAADLALQGQDIVQQNYTFSAFKQSVLSVFDP